MGNLEELVASVIADGVVDAEEAATLRAVVFADGVVDKEEADALFAINDAVSGNDNDPAWEKLFVDAIGSYVLDDDKTPGVVDDAEAVYLVAKIFADGTVDSVEQALLDHIKANAKKVSQLLSDRF